MVTRHHKKEQPLRWVIESLEEERSYFEKPMFGCLAVYLHGRLSLLLTSGEEPWNGLLIPTDHQFHDSICGRRGKKTDSGGTESVALGAGL